MRAVEVDWGFNWLWPSGVPPANRVSLSRAGQPYVSLNQYGHYITPTALSSACVLIWLLTPLQTLRVQACCMFGVCHGCERLVAVGGALVLRVCVGSDRVE